MVLINETSLERVINKHLKEVTVIISASTMEHTEVENNQRTNELKKDIIAKQLSFIPVGGGYKYREKDEEKEGIEKSFIILPYKYTTRVVNGEREKGNIVQPKELFNFGKQLAKKYDQESFLFVDGSGKTKGDVTAKYYNQNGSQVEWSDGFKGLKVNDLKEIYFTSLRRKGKDLKKTGKADRRFTMTEDIFVEKHSSRNEARASLISGEVVDPFQFFYRVDK